MKRITFGHIVNHREPKGTKYVLEAVEKLRNEGFDFGFIFAEKIPHEAALELYRHIDVLLEQFVIGWYGGQAVECMAMGIPVVVWLREEDLKFIPILMQGDFPLIRASKKYLPVLMKEIIKGSIDLTYYSENGKVYAKKWHNPKRIAKEMLCSACGLSHPDGCV